MKNNLLGNNTAALLRIASVVAFLQYGAHALLFLLSIARGPAPIAAIAASSRHSYWDFYVGYGLLAILSGAVEVALLWQLAAMAKLDVARTRPVAMLFVFANAAHAVLIWNYFSLIVPVTFDLAIAGLLTFAFAAAKPKHLTPHLALAHTT